MIMRTKQSVASTRIPNNIIDDCEVSTNARFLLIFMLSKPDDTKFSFERLSKDIGWGMDKLRNAMNELKEAGYVDIQMVKSQIGRYQYSKWIIRDKTSKKK